LKYHIYLSSLRLYTKFYRISQMKDISEITVSKLKVNMYVIAVTAAATGVFVGMALMFHGSLLRGERPHIWLLFSLLIGIVLHEVLHGLGYRTWGKLGWDGIRFGLSLKGVMLYCHARRPMPLKAYRRSLLLPVIVTGLLPATLLVWFPYLWLALYCGLMVGAGAGDLLVLAHLRGIGGDLLVQDHPSEVGCRVYEFGTGIASSKVVERR